MASWADTIESWPVGTHVWGQYAEQIADRVAVCRTENVSAPPRPRRARRRLRPRSRPGRSASPRPCSRTRSTTSTRAERGSGPTRTVSRIRAWHALSILVAIDECTTESGCLWLAEGVDEPLPTDDRGVVRDDVVDSLHWAPAELAAGDAVLLDGLAPHYSDANRGDRRRRARRQLRAVWRALLARALLPARTRCVGPRRRTGGSGSARWPTSPASRSPWRTRHRTGARISRWRRLDRQVHRHRPPPAGSRRTIRCEHVFVSVRRPSCMPTSTPSMPPSSNGTILGCSAAR